MASLDLHSVQHPEYSAAKIDWRIWRFTYEGGRLFIWDFLEKYSNREGDRDFEKRRRMTYNPGFARAAVDEVKNSISQRLVDVSRAGGSKTYQDAVRGDNFGVDLLGKSMNAFISTEVLPEMLSMQKVGIYVDMPKLTGNETISQKGNKRPYIYIYRTEDIRSWQWDTENNPNEFKSVLLVDREFEFDELTGLPMSEVVKFRQLSIIEEDGRRKVLVQRYDEESQLEEQVVLDIDRIPFIVLQLPDSLMKDAAHYQIALLNLTSSDLHYCLTANFPFYTEQYSPFAQNQYNKGEEAIKQIETDRWTFQSQTETMEQVRLGTGAGRRYPQGLERPGFIHPSSEPLDASMRKQEQIKDDMRTIVGLTLSTFRPQKASAESKQVDKEGLEAGLSSIGILLEFGERKIAEFWTMYEGGPAPAAINYPERYSLLSDQDRRDEVKALRDEMKTASSDTYRRRLLKRIAYLTIGCYVQYDELTKIYDEIDKAEIIIPDMDFINTAVMGGYLDPQRAAVAFGWPKETVADAAEYHAERLKRIQQAQTDPAARGVTDKGNDPTAGKLERQGATDPTANPNPGPLVKGPGKPEDMSL